MTVVFSNDSISSISIDKGNAQTQEVLKNGSILDYEGLVSEIEFKENPVLPQGKSAKHFFKVNGTAIEFSHYDKENKVIVFSEYIRGRERDTKKLKKTSIKLSAGEIFSCYRNDQKIKSLYIKEKKPSVHELLTNLQVVVKKQPSAFDADTVDFEYSIEGLEKITNLTKKLYYKYKNKEFAIPYKAEAALLKFKIQTSGLEEGNPVEISLKVSDKSSDKNRTLTLYKGEIIKNNNSNIIIITVLAIIGALLLLLLILIYIWNRKFKHAIVFKSVNDDIEFKVNCIDVPKLGDLSNKSGICTTSEGRVYKFRKRSKLGFPKLVYIGYEVKCKDSSSFVIDTKGASKASKVYIKLNDNNIFLNLGASAEKDGIYEYEDHQITIENGRIKSIAKVVIDPHTNKRYTIILNKNTPQKNDIVEPCNKKKYYSFESSDHTIYEVSNNKIERIRANNDIITELTSVEGIKIKVIKRGETPSEGDIATPDGKYYFNNNDIYIIENGQIKSILKKEEQTQNIKSLEHALADAELEIEKLSKRPTLDSFNELRAQLTAANEKLSNVDKNIENAVNRVIAEERYKVEVFYKKKIAEEYISAKSYQQEKNFYEKKLIDSEQRIKKVEDLIRLKDNEIKSENERIKTLLAEKETKAQSIIHLNASLAKMKECMRQKNVHYMIQIQETLFEISESFKDVYKNMDESIIKEGLVYPMVKGVSGLSLGLILWSEEFSVKVLGDTEAFFGTDYLFMKEMDVKDILSKKFISNIVKSDSFSKFIRLYQLSMVPFIRQQLMNAKMDLEILNKLYYKLYTLVTDFGFTIICPRILEEQYNENKYQWFNSTNLFNIINLSNENKAMIKEKGADIIIDVNQIGYDSPWITRKATVVTPDF